MSYHLIALTLIAGIITLGVLCRRSLYSPLFINAFSWSVTFISGVFFYDDFYPLTEQVFVAWLCWFIITSFFFFILKPHPLNKVPFILRSPLTLKMRYFPVVCLLILWLAYRIWVVGSSGPAHFFLNLRLASNGLEGFGTLGLVSRVYPLIIALFIFEQLNFKPERKADCFSLFAWLLIYGFGTMGKFAILTPIFIWGVTAGMQNRVNKLRLMQIIGLALVLMFMAHIMRSGPESGFNLFKMLAVYTYSPIVALGYLDIPDSQHFGEYSLRFFYAVGHALALTPKPVEVIMDYVSIPELTNVYTVLLPFYYDFSLFGVIFFACLYGVLFGGLYSLVNQKTSFYFAVYLSVAMVLFSQFFIESLFTTMSSYLQVIICLILLYLFSKRSVSK